MLSAAQGRVLAALTGVFLTRVAITLFWPLPSLLSLQPIEGFVS